MYLRSGHFLYNSTVYNTIDSHILFRREERHRDRKSSNMSSFTYILFLNTFLLTASGTVDPSTNVWTDWDKRQTCTPTNGIHQPASIDELVQIVSVAEFMETQLKTVGSGHSFSQITLTDDGRVNGSMIVNLDNIKKVLKLPTDNDHTVTVEAGIRVQ